MSGPSWHFAPPHPEPRALSIRLAEQSENALRTGIGLRQHRRAGLNQDVVLGEVGTLLRDIDVFDAAVGSRHVVFKSPQLLLIHIQGRLIGTHRGPIGGQLIDGELHLGQRGGRIGGRREAD